MAYTNDYGQPEQGYAATKAPERPLERIGIAAERIERCAALVQDFIDRCNVGGSGVLAQSGQPRPPYSGHVGNIARLFDELERLESHVAALNSIG